MKIKNICTASGRASYRHVLLLSCVLAILTACASTRQAELILTDHPLVDRIWDVKKQTFIERAELSQKMLASEYLLLGERHDNMAHHQHQTWAIEQLHVARKQAAVAFEMVDDRQGNLLARHRISSVEQMIAVLGQFKNHWYYEQRYKDLFSAVLAAGYAVVPANLSRDRLKQISKKGEDGLPGAYRKMLKQVSLSDRQMQSLLREIKASHCNMLGDKTAAKLALSQRLRDAVMAHSLSKIRTPLKVFIAGAGHVRKDRGVPLYLANINKGARVLSLGFSEVDADKIHATDYARRWGGKQLPFDYVWFTPQVKRADLCEQFKKHMQQKNKHVK